MFISSEDCNDVSEEFAPGTSISPRAHNKVTPDFRCHVNHHSRYGTAEEGTPPVSRELNHQSFEGYPFSLFFFFLSLNDRRIRDADELRLLPGMSAEELLFTF